MRHATAVRRLRTIAERCQQVCGLWDDDSGLMAVHAFGRVLDPAGERRGSLEVVQIALVVQEDPEQVAWCVRPPQYAGLGYVLELEKAPVDWYFRPAALPVGNHVIVRPLQIWDRRTGVAERALAALAAGTAEPLRARAPRPDVLHRQLTEELATALTHLEGVRDGYWQRDWRSRHESVATFPEHHLWDAVNGYLELLQAVRNGPAAAEGQDADGQDADDSA
jgi:hypothetical protein